MKNSTPIVLDRLAGALQKHGVRLKRMQLLQAAAQAFGYRNTHELSAADQAGDLQPPEARYIGRIQVAPVGWMHFLEGNEGGVFAVDQKRFDEQTGRAADWITSPLGGLLDVKAMRSAASAPNAPQAQDDKISGRIDADKCGATGDDVVATLAIRSQLNRAIYKVVRDHRMSNMADEDGYVGYPLVDLMSNPAPDTIATGEMEMIYLVDEIEGAVREMLGIKDEEATLEANLDAMIAKLPAPRVTRVGQDDLASVAMSPIDPEEPAYMTNACCEVASVTQADLDDLGLTYGSYEGEFYPLTDAEAQYIAEDVVDGADGKYGAMTGYSVLYRGKKYLMPSIEIMNGPDDNFPFASREEVRRDARSYAERIKPKVLNMGGHVLIEESYDDRFIVQILVPFESVMALGDKSIWHQRLSNLIADPDVMQTIEGRYPIRHQGANFAVSVEWIGEGEDGDFDPEDPADMPLLRFDAQRLVNGQWEDIPDGSYCTQVPAWCNISLARELANYIVDTLEVEGGAHPKRLLEGQSWACETMMKIHAANRINVNVTKQRHAQATRVYGNPQQGISIVLGKYADGGISCAVYNNEHCTGFAELRDIHAAHAWLKTHPSTNTDIDGLTTQSAALAPQISTNHPENVQWVLVDGNESESDWFEPDEEYPFERSFIQIEDMTV